MGIMYVDLIDEEVFVELLNTLGLSLPLETEPMAAAHAVIDWANASEQQAQQLKILAAQLQEKTGVMLPEIKEALTLMLESCP